MANTDNITDYFEYLAEMLKAVQALIPEDDMYPEWRVTEMHGSGSWIWEREGSNVWAYATPWWEDGNTEVIPVSLCTEAYDDGLYADDITFARPTGDAALDAVRYYKAMSAWLKNITGV